MRAENISETLQTQVFDEVDVLVAGGGVSGVVAAIAAARLGTRVLVIERQGVLGGNATTGMVAQWLGFFHRHVQVVRGIAGELTERMISVGGSPGFIQYVLAEASASPLPIVTFPFDPEILKLVLDDALISSGAEVLFHASGVRPVLRDETVCGLAIETVGGRRAVLAKVVIDATGDGTVAARAGAMTMGEEESERRNRQPGSLVFRLSDVDGGRFRALPRSEKRRLALAGVASGELAWESLSFGSMPGGTDAIGLVTRLSGFDFLDATDASRAEVEGRRQVAKAVEFLRREVPGFADCRISSIAARVGVRETRRICGETTLREEDILSNRRFADSIALGSGPIDLHDPHGSGIQLHMPSAPFEIPMSCMLPKSIKDLIITGRAISATRAANGGARHMATAMALGEAAGTLAAIACKDNSLPPHDVSSLRVRSCLRDGGALVALDDIQGANEQNPFPTVHARGITIEP